MTFNYLTGSKQARMGGRPRQGAAGRGRWAQPTARAIRAARSLSRSRVWLVPENTSMSPDLASRTCTMIGPAGVLASPWAFGWSGADGRLVAARAGVAAVPMAVAARPAAPAAAAPWSRERRDRRLPEGSGSDARFAS